MVVLALQWLNWLVMLRFLQKNYDLEAAFLERVIMRELN